MFITFIGAARTVTGSLYLIEFKKQKFLLECGLYQGHREEAERINRTFPFKPREIKSVILSHAHLDHSGNLPSLSKRGFFGLVYSTSATLDIGSLLLLDTAHLQEADIKYFNKKQEKRGLPKKEPLYVMQDAENVLSQFNPVPYEKKFEPVEGVRVTLYDAGHILGSAIVLLETEEERILFSGDLGRKNMPIINDPTIINDIDYLIIESTYGARIHPSLEGVNEEFKRLIETAKQKKSKVIIPAFAVERTQVLIKILKELYDEGILKGVPVYIDSPLATNVTNIFKKHTECFDEEIQKRFKHEDPFDFADLYYIKEVEESKRLNDKKGPMIIIAGSGMCEGGRVLHHLIHSIEDENNMIMLTSFQARGTLGRKLKDGINKVSIFNEEYSVRSQVYFFSALSAHADGNDLFEYVKLSKDNRLKRVFLVHGDIEEAIVLKERVNSLGIEADIPESMTTIET